MRPLAFMGYLEGPQRADTAYGLGAQQAIEVLDLENTGVSMGKMACLIRDVRPDGYIPLTNRNLLRVNPDFSFIDPRQNPIHPIWSEGRDGVLSEHADHVVFSMLMPIDERKKRRSVWWLVCALPPPSFVLS